MKSAKNKRSAVAAALSVAALFFLGSADASGVTFYTNKTDFLNAITGSSYTETFDSIPVDQTITAPTNFSGNGYSFSATTASGADLYGLGTVAPDHWLTTYNEGNPLVFTNFSLNATAFGGYFFNTDNNGSQIAFNLTLQAIGDGTTNTQSLTPTTASNFFGWTFGTGIASVTVSSTNYYPTANNVVLGTTVPEPSTWALLLLGAGATGLTLWRRRR